jgi:hypothetical protein
MECASSGDVKTRKTEAMMVDRRGFVKLVSQC